MKNIDRLLKVLPEYDLPQGLIDIVDINASPHLWLRALANDIEYQLAVTRGERESIATIYRILNQIHNLTRDIESSASRKYELKCRLLADSTSTLSPSNCVIKHRNTIDLTNIVTLFDSKNTKSFGVSERKSES